MDVALLRATIVDADGNPVLDATNNVTFTINSGPGFIAGVGNGDPSCQEPSQVRSDATLSSLVHRYDAASHGHACK